LPAGGGDSGSRLHYHGSAQSLTDRPTVCHVPDDVGEAAEWQTRPGAPLCGRCAITCLSGVTLGSGVVCSRIDNALSDA